MNRIDYKDLNYFTTTQLVSMSNYLKIPCTSIATFADGSIQQINILPKHIIILRLLDYFNNNICDNKPIQINSCHVAPKIKFNVSFKLNDFVQVNRFDINNWNCRAFLWKNGMPPDYRIASLVHKMWIERLYPFTYTQLQIEYIKHSIGKMNNNSLESNILQNNELLLECCNKITNHTYIPIINLIYEMIRNKIN